MNHLDEIFTVFSDNLINHIPKEIDKEDVSLYFAYYYEHFALSSYDVFSSNMVVESSYTLPMETYLEDRIKKYETEHGKIKEINKVWLLMHLMVLSKCSESYSLTFMHNVTEGLVKKFESLDEPFLKYYINQLNTALMSETGIALVPRPIEIVKSDINKLKGFTPFFNEVLHSIDLAKDILSNRVADQDIKDLNDYIDLRFLKYVTKYEVLAEYFSGVIVLKRNVIIKSPTDDDKILKLKEQSLREEIKNFIDATCDIDEDEESRLLDELVILVDSLLL